ncbi:serine/threonine protein kinase [Spongiactinospora rosea]|uniref:Serine/threonine protein kinase n=1 Tax=Spongiactinospora rosea TaxID=2248750 RepID=A0A366LIZ0_9ACTN|nr:serine/threonine-protein kinase [Spongiactinospora rosea]RBQ13857.1 serine/threonine protein kinase [Spongiactinospora rosea]
MGKLGRVGPYTLLERLGRGAMGEVYLASTRRGDRVAVKLLRDSPDYDAEARLRLEREVRALRRVESPYVARVLDADLRARRPYLVMEHIDGETLLERVRRDGPFEQAELVELALRMTTALAIIHAAGVVHRDMKPGNVLIGPEGPILIDFGIAQLVDATRLTMTGTFLGTPGYAAPELFADEPVGQPADVYAWAATIAFAGTGRPTFSGGTAEALMYAILNGQADLEGVPAALLPLIKAGLNRSPAKRPTAALLADRLTRLAKATRVSGADEGGAAEAGPPITDEPAAVATDLAEGVPGVKRGGARTASARPPRRGEPEQASAAEEGVPGGGRRRVAAAAAAEARGKEAEAVKAPGRGRTGAAEPREDIRVATASPEKTGRVKGGAEGGRTALEGRGKGAADGGGRGVAEGRAKAAVDGGRGTKAGVKAAMDGGRGATAGVQVRARRAVRRTSTGPLPAGNAALLVLAVLAAPCVVASVIWAPVTPVLTAVFVVLVRTIWLGHWSVRKRRSAPARRILRVVSFPLTLAVSALSAVLWPGVPAAGAAGLTLWAVSGGHLGPVWWEEPVPVTVAGVVFAVVCGAIIGREIERVGPALPELRREGLRALAVLGGFVALCAATVRVISLLL